MEQADARLELLFSEAVRGVQRQATAVDELRTRATALVASAAVVAAFLGEPALEKGGWAAGSGATAFAAAGATAAFVLWPRTWTFTIHPHKVLANHIMRPDGTPLDQLRLALAKELGAAYHENETRRRWLVRGVAGACIALVVEVIGFLIAV